MTTERAIEILDPEHREHYESIEPVNEACRMAISAHKKQMPMQITEVHVDEYICPACGAENSCEQGIVEDKFCPECGQALKKLGGTD